MSVTLRFQYDTVHDAHICEALGSIEALADCEQWYRTAVEYFMGCPQPADAIFIVDHLAVAANVALPWARYCAMLRDNFVRHSVCSVSDLETAFARLDDLREDKVAYEALVDARSLHV